MKKDDRRANAGQRVAPKRKGPRRARRHESATDFELRLWRAARQRSLREHDPARTTS